MQISTQLRNTVNSTSWLFSMLIGSNVNITMLWVGKFWRKHSIQPSGSKNFMSLFNEQTHVNDMFAIELHPSLTEYINFCNISLSFNWWWMSVCLNFDSTSPGGDKEHCLVNHMFFGFFLGVVQNEMLHFNPTITCIYSTMAEHGWTWKGIVPHHVHPSIQLQVPSMVDSLVQVKTWVLLM